MTSWRRRLPGSDLPSAPTCWRTARLRSLYQASSTTRMRRMAHSSATRLRACTSFVRWTRSKVGRVWRSVGHDPAWKHCIKLPRRWAFSKVRSSKFPESQEVWPLGGCISIPHLAHSGSRGNSDLRRTHRHMNAVVKTQHGEVRGSATDGVNTFKGIPYAAPPFGANRLRPPQPVERWSGIRDALAFGPTPPQLQIPPPVGTLVPNPTIPGEECLNLNLWTPEVGAAGHPVMVWIPGGAFESVSAPAYDGSHFARDGVVCVTINYRVGAEGFLYLGDGDTNLGLLDQVAALEWVQENIAAFGGDPTNVTVFGQSAGAMSIGTLLSMPRAKGLFRRAIAQSGGAHQVTSVGAAEKVTRQLAQKLGVPATRDAIAAIAPGRLVQAHAELKAELSAHPDPERWDRETAISMLLWQPVLDGSVIPSRPIDCIAAGAGADIDLMTGSTTEEWNFMLVPGGVIDHITP